MWEVKCIAEGKKTTSKYTSMNYVMEWNATRISESFGTLPCFSDKDSCNQKVPNKPFSNAAENLI